MTNKRVLVIGAGGFIGRKLVERLRDKFPSYVVSRWSSEHDIRDQIVVQEIVNEKPDIIIIAAGKSFVPDSWISPLDFYAINTMGVAHVAEAARILKAKIIFLSTFVYGEPYSLPINENNSVDTFNPYASSKYAGEQILNDYRRHFGVESNVLRVFNVYGKGQRSEFLIPMLIEQFQNENQIKVKDLTPKRDYVHVDDLIEAIIAAMFIFNGYQVYNVAGGKSYSVLEVIQTIFRAGKKSKEIVSEKLSRPNEVKDTLADISKIKEKLNWSPMISFEKGIDELLK